VITSYTPTHTRIYRLVCFFGLLLNGFLVVSMLLIDTNLTVMGEEWYSPNPATFDLIEGVVLMMLATEICVHSVAQWGSYFKSLWNWVDITVLLVCLVVLVLTLDHPAGLHPDPDRVAIPTAWKLDLFKISSSDVAEKVQNGTTHVPTPSPTGDDQAGSSGSTLDIIAMACRS